jgi:hypothetical protein
MLEHFKIALFILYSRKETKAVEDLDDLASSSEIVIDCHE